MDHVPSEEDISFLTFSLTEVRTYSISLHKIAAFVKNTRLIRRVFCGIILLRVHYAYAKKEIELAYHIGCILK